MPDGAEIDDRAGPGWRSLGLALAGYAAAVAVATYPMVRHASTAIASRVDPVAHLIVMRWYRTVLLEGGSPFLHPGIQYPFGAPIGSFPPMHLQTLIYLILSATTANDALAYNVLWFAGFLLTGIGTFVLAFRAVGDRACAWVAGLMAMLSGPMMLHAHGHLELMYLGWFALFLSAWIGLIDRPGRARLAAAVLLYLLMAMSTAYFAVMAVVPAAWYVLAGMVAAGRRGARGWLASRLGWLAGFAAAVLPPLLAIFAGQLWGKWHGVEMDRPRSEFARLGAPWWSYAVPSSSHRLHLSGSVDPYEAAGRPAVECGSYLGLATLGLVLLAAIRRVGPRRASYWWSVGAVLIVLSLGPDARFGTVRIPMPDAWLWDHVVAFRWLRSIGRFNLLVSVCAAVIAASGLKDLLARWPGRKGRAAACVGLTAWIVADLGMAPFPAEPIAPVPACYASILDRDPQATFLEAPVRDSGHADPLTSATGYWQSIHRGSTTGGYSSHANSAFDNRLVHNSPFSADAMACPGYLAGEGPATFGIVAGVSFRDYAWLALTASDLRYVVLHQSPEFLAGAAPGTPRLKALLAKALIYEDAATAVYDRGRLDPPRRPALACSGGWRGGWHGREVLIASREATLSACSPEPDQDLIFTLAARSFREARTVRLLDDGRELARWEVRPEGPATYRSPPFRLASGLRRLTIESDGESAPRRRHEYVTDGDDRPFSLTVSSVRLEPAAEAGRVAAGSAPGEARTK